MPSSCTETGSRTARGAQEQQHKAVFSVRRGAASAHKFSVSRWAARPPAPPAPELPGGRAHSVSSALFLGLLLRIRQKSRMGGRRMAAAVLQSDVSSVKFSQASWPRGTHLVGALCSVAWYPVDTGLFVSGSFDHHVKASVSLPHTL